VSVLCRVGLLGNAVLTMGGSFRPRLNIGQSPIAHKYREGKMQRTLKKESKGLEIAQRETIETSLHLPFHRSSCLLPASAVLYSPQHRARLREASGSFGGSFFGRSACFCAMAKPFQDPFIIVLSPFWGVSSAWNNSSFLLL